MARPRCSLDASILPFKLDRRCRSRRRRGSLSPRPTITHPTLGAAKIVYELVTNGLYWDTASQMYRLSWISGVTAVTHPVYQQVTRVLPSGVAILRRAQPARRQH